ncbi:VWD domain-containing protein, partial [Arthrobacter sp. M4]|uniref:VWD domain-containing protein n=1 Tax=Arthrobacter sp. M4 TaxID=218160 RepID=UPI001CDBCF5D
MQVVPATIPKELNDEFRVRVGICEETAQDLFANFSVFPSPTTQGMLVVEEKSRDACFGRVIRPVTRPQESDRDKDYTAEEPKTYPRSIPAPDFVELPETESPTGKFPVPAQVPQPAPTTVQCDALCVDETVRITWGLYTQQLAESWREFGENAEQLRLQIREKWLSFWQSVNARSYGDPHIMTIDGLKYDLQAVGEFDMVSSEQWDFRVQARFSPAMWGTFSRLSVVAFSLDGHPVQLGDGGVMVDHAPATVPDGGYLYFDRGAALFRSGDEYLAIWPGQSLRPMMLYNPTDGARFYLPPDTKTAGLLGNNNGSVDDDLALRDGTQLSRTASPQTLHGTFADSWRISNEDSFFTYDSGQSTATFTDRAYPRQITTLGDFSELQIRDASAICTSYGVVRGPLLDGCTLDVLTTGDNSFAGAASAITANIVGADARTVDSSGALTVDFEENVPSNFDDVYISADAATTRYAGPIIGNEYGFVTKELPAHVNAGISFDLLLLGNWDNDGVEQKISLNIDGTTSWSATFPDSGQTPTGLGTPRLTGTLSTGVPFSIYTVALSQNHTASQLKAELTATGMSAAGHKAIGIDNLHMQLDLVPPEVFNVALPASVSNGLPATGAGNLETKVSHDQYRFSQSSQGGVLLDLQNCSPNLRWILTNTGTGATPATGYCSQGDKEISNLPPGQYMLDFGGSNDVQGTYSFALMPVGVQTFDVSLPVSVSNGVPGPGEGNLETKGSHDQYRFNLASPGGVFLDLQNCSTYLRWTVTNTDTGITPAAGSGYCYQGDKQIDNLPAG